MYSAGLFTANLGNRSVANAYCQAAAAPGQCPSAYAFLTFDDEDIAQLPLPLMTAVMDPVTGAVIAEGFHDDIIQASFAAHYGTWWSGMDSLGIAYPGATCGNWQNTSTCARGALGQTSIHWYVSSCDGTRNLLCICNGGSSVPTRSPSSSAPSLSPSSAPTIAETLPPTLGPTQSPVRTPLIVTLFPEAGATKRIWLTEVQVFTADSPSVNVATLVSALIVDTFGSYVAANGADGNFSTIAASTAGSSNSARFELGFINGASGAITKVKIFLDPSMPDAGSWPGMLVILSRNGVLLYPGVASLPGADSGDDYSVSFTVTVPL